SAVTTVARSSWKSTSASHADPIAGATASCAKRSVTSIRAVPRARSGALLSNIGAPAATGQHRPAERRAIVGPMLAARAPSRPGLAFALALGAALLGGADPAGAQTFAVQRARLVREIERDVRATARYTGM